MEEAFENTRAYFLYKHNVLCKFCMSFSSGNYNVHIEFNIYFLLLVFYDSLAKGCGIDI